MAKNYQYRAQMNILQGGYSGEIKGVDPADDSWHTTSATSGTSTHTYYYNDSTCASNANSSQVRVQIQDSWTVDIDNRNYMTVTVNSRILSIDRVTYQGNANACGNIRCTVSIYRYQGGSLLAQFPNLNLAAIGNISGPVDLGSYTFTLAPGENAQRSTLYYVNDALGTPYDDAFAMGISFKNILPKDYRPGKISDGGNWLSHNRGGTAITATVQGTDISITNAGTKLKSLNRVLGGLKQATSTGKNRLKNIFQLSNTDNGIVTETLSSGATHIAGTLTATSASVSPVVANNLPAGNYTFSISHSLGRILVLTTYLSADYSISTDQVIAPGDTSTTFNSGAIYGTSLTIGGQVNDTIDETLFIQLESGTSATDWEPFTDGYSGPNDTYPISIQSVSNYQTYTISDGNNQSASYRLNLGDLELGEINNNQDYIYKNGDKWYLHKEIDKILSYNGETIRTDWLSTTGNLDTGATVYYILVSPIETEITDETITNMLDNFSTVPIYTGNTNINVTASGIGTNVPIAGEINVTYMTNSSTPASGAANIWNGSSWLEMRTADGPTSSDNPPLIMHPTGYKNQRLIGEE